MLESASEGKISMLEQCFRALSGLKARSSSDFECSPGHPLGTYLATYLAPTWPDRRAIGALVYLAPYLATYLVPT